MAIGENAGIMPVMNMNPNGYGDGWGFGGCFMWVILLFFLMGGNGWGNNTQAADLAAAKTRETIWQSNDQQNLMGAVNTVRESNIALGNGICDSTFALNTTALNGFNGVQRDILTSSNNMNMNLTNIGHANQIQGLQNTNAITAAINNNRFATDLGFDGVTHGLEEIKYNNALNTCNITSTSTANTQKILDKLSAMEMNAKDTEIANLRSQLSQANLTVSQYDQNATLVGALRPYPQPAYLVTSPYTGIYNAFQNA